MFRKGLTYNTVRSYLYSLAAEIKFRGGIDILNKDNNWFIHATMKHFIKKLGNKPIIYRKALTVDLLESLLCGINLSTFDDWVFATMLVVGVYCLMRVGEICSSTYEKKSKFIRNRDITFNKDHVLFTLWSTKTDTGNLGMLKWITDIKNVRFNPFDMVCRLKMMKTNTTGLNDAFFTLSSGKIVNRYMLVTFLQTNMLKVFPGCNVREWTGISLRKGGATSALRAGIPGEVIQKMGNWKSDIYKSYVQHDRTDVANAQTKMATRLH
jgi:hypothetical protein